MPRFICDRCGMTIPPHAHYVVKIEVYADPSLPAVSSDDLEETDYAQRTADLLREMQGMSAQELEDAVHWKREFKICRPCQVALLKDPLGAIA
jgi:ribosomal protein L40E